MDTFRQSRIIGCAKGFFSVLRRMRRIVRIDYVALHNSALPLPLTHTANDLYVAEDEIIHLALSDRRGRHGQHRARKARDGLNNIGNKQHDQKQ